MRPHIDSLDQARRRRLRKVFHPTGNFTVVDSLAVAERRLPRLILVTESDNEITAGSSNLPLTSVVDGSSTGNASSPLTTNGAFWTGIPAARFVSFAIKPLL